MIEKLARYAHTSWSGWMRYLFKNSKHNKNGTVTIPKELVDRWMRQMNTKYENLPEDEKQSDRKEAREILAIMIHTLNAE